MKISIYNDERVTYIGEDYYHLRFDLKMLFKVKTTITTFYVFADFVSAIGGSFSTYTLVFITIPAALFIDKEFLSYITKHLLEKEQCKRSR